MKAIESPLIRHLVAHVKKGEKCEFTVHTNYINSAEEESLEDHTLNELLGQTFDSNSELYVDIHLIQLSKVEDWYKDGTTLVKTLRKGGKGRSPYSDSFIKCKKS